MARRKSFLLWLAAFLAACLAGCAGAIDQTITFLADEAWESQATLSFPAEVAVLIGSQVDDELNALQQRIEAQGGEMQWARRDENGASAYTITAAGRGYDILSDITFSDMSVQVSEPDGRRQLTFTAAPAADAAGQTLTVVGGEILSGNGTISGDSVSWVNPSQVMQAVLTEQGGATPLPIAPIAGGVALILLGLLLAWYLLRQRAMTPAWTADPVPPSPPTRRTPDEPGGPAAARPTPIGAQAGGPVCVNCGAALRPAARFCATCGHPQPE